MEDNPYSQMLSTLRADNDSRRLDGWVLGKVSSVKPLQINFAHQTLEESDLYVNIQLVENEEDVDFTDVSGTLQGTVDCSVGSISQMNVSSGKLKMSGKPFRGVLEEGDQVCLLQSLDGQKYVVVCKVVGASG